MSDTLLGWHCLAADRRLQFVPHTLVEVGQTLTLPRGVTPALCQTGYHASIRLLDALTYAPSDPGLVCCRVSLEGAIVYDTDKAVASARTCLAMVDADVIVREYACWCAEGALLGLSLRSIPVDERSWQAVVTTRQWLRGEVSAAARAAARAAAWAASRDAAWAVMNAELETRMLAAMGRTQ